MVTRIDIDRHVRGYARPEIGWDPKSGGLAWIGDETWGE